MAFNGSLKRCLPEIVRTFFLFFISSVLGACGGAGEDVERCIEDGSCDAVLNVMKVSGDLPLDPLAPLWGGTGGTTPIAVELGPQMITNPKWPNPAVQGVKVNAARNETHLAIYLEWKDESIDEEYGHSALYSDQAAVMFPVRSMGEVLPITMGAEGLTVNIWQWKAIWERQMDTKKRRGSRAALNTPSSGIPDRVSPIEDLNAEGFSTLTTQDQQDVLGKGVWRNKVWRIVLMRPLTNSDPQDVQFRHSVQMAIAVWNGANRERNGQKGISPWILLRLS